MPAKEPASWLLRQGSNLNFSDPESDVLPITPRSSFAAQIYIKYGKSTNRKKSYMSHITGLEPATCNMQHATFPLPSDSVVYRQPGPHQLDRKITRRKPESRKPFRRPEFEKNPVIGRCTPPEPVQTDSSHQQLIKLTFLMNGDRNTWLAIMVCG